MAMVAGIGGHKTLVPNQSNACCRSGNTPRRQRRSESRRANQRTPVLFIPIHLGCSIKNLSAAASRSLKGHSVSRSSLSAPLVPNQERATTATRLGRRNGTGCVLYGAWGSSTSSGTRRSPAHGRTTATASSASTPLSRPRPWPPRTSHPAASPSPGRHLSRCHPANQAPCRRPRPARRTPRSQELPVARRRWTAGGRSGGNPRWPTSTSSWRRRPSGPEAPPCTTGW